MFDYILSPVYILSILILLGNMFQKTIDLLNVLLQEREECPFAAGWEAAKILNETATPRPVCRLLVASLHVVFLNMSHGVADELKNNFFYLHIFIGEKPRTIREMKGWVSFLRHLSPLTLQPKPVCGSNILYDKLKCLKWVRTKRDWIWCLPVP